MSDTEAIRASEMLGLSAHEGRDNGVQQVDAVPGEYDVVFNQKQGPMLGEPIGVVRMPGRTKVAIVGFAESTKGMVPYADPTFEVWSLNQHYRFMPRASRWFEIHTRKQYLSDVVQGTDYLSWLQRLPIAVYVTEMFPDMPTAIPFDWERYRQMAGVWEQDKETKAYSVRDYTQSSLVLMLAQALMEGFPIIHIYGVDLVIGAEYHYQKPNMEWLIGFAQGQGYTVTRGDEPQGKARELFIPRRSALLRQLYSYGPEVSGIKSPMPRLLADRLKKLTDVREGLLTQLNNCDGCINETQQWISMFDMHERGGVVGWRFSDDHWEQIEPF